MSDKAKGNAKQEMTEEDQQMMAALLDENLDDIPDLPRFGVPPKGAYKFKIVGFPYKKVNDKPCVEIQVMILETRELANPDAVPPEAGMNVTELVWFHNDPIKAKGVLKQKLEGVAGDLGEGNLAKLLEMVVGMEVNGTCDTRKDKDDPEKLYPNLQFTGLAQS